MKLRTLVGAAEMAWGAARLAGMRRSCGPASSVNAANG
jgi:hypothetical protein